MKTVIGFAAHPDDLEFSSTGTMKKLRDDGYDIYYVILTNGENGFKSEPHVTAEQRVRIRKNEQLQVAEKLGVKRVHFLDYKDGFLQYTEELRAQLVAIIKEYKPEIVFSFDPANSSYNNLNVFHRDHRVTALAVFDACFAAKNFHMYPGQAHRIEKFFFFASDHPNHFEDISDLMDFKLNLLACHKSQFPDFSKAEKYVKEKISNNTDQYRYSEPFRIMQVEQYT